MTKGHRALLPRIRKSGDLFTPSLFRRFEWQRPEPTHFLYDILRLGLGLMSNLQNSDTVSSQIGKYFLSD